MIFSKDEKHHKTIYTLTIDDSELVPASQYEQGLFDKYMKSNEIGDKLLALELLVRKIEHAQKWR